MSVVLRVYVRACVRACVCVCDIYTNRTLRKAATLIPDSTHPANHLFESLPSGKWFRSIKTRTTCFINSFYPKAVQTKPPNTKSKE